ncbi:DUF1365 domain-containing protein [Kaarinaea lacus]
MNSYIYAGQVRHRRFRPKSHCFQYRLFMMLLDLAELDTVFKNRWFWSSRGFNLAWFRRKDHMGDPNKPLADEVRRLVYEQTGSKSQGPIRLLTHLRYFGYCFNPVSFYYCYDVDDTRVETIVAEVNNTPWREQHCYVLTDAMNQGHDRHKRYNFDKNFHVSPFMEFALQYDWRFSAPDKHLNVHMQNLKYSEKQQHKIFDATLVLNQQPVTGLNLAKVLIKYPFMTLKVTAGIYYQALKLWLKGVTFYEHPRHSRNSQSNLLQKDEHIRHSTH